MLNNHRVILMRDEIKNYTLVEEVEVPLEYLVMLGRSAVNNSIVREVRARFPDAMFGPAYDKRRREKDRVSGVYRPKSR